MEPHDLRPNLEPTMPRLALSREQARDFLRQGAMFEITPRRAFGLIERAEEFASAATRWVWD